MNTESQAVRELRKAATCLYIAVDESVAKDVASKVESVLAELAACQAELATGMKPEPTVSLEQINRNVDEIGSALQPGMVLVSELEKLTYVYEQKLIHVHERALKAEAQLAACQADRSRRPKIICICGSSRFVGQMAVKAWELEKTGVIVFSLHLLPQWYEGVQEHHQAESENVAHILDELHLRKIDLSDEVLVMNVGGYIGKRTAIEIAYAKQHQKPIVYLETV